MKRALLVVLAALALVPALGALPLTVSWADGKVDFQKGSAWLAIGIGDKLDSAATVRLAAGASVELTDGKRKVSLTAAGLYIPDTLFKQGGDADKRKSSALAKLGKLVDPALSTSSTAAAAVRGAAVEPSKDETTWMSDTVDVTAIMDEGRKLAKGGDFASAALKFDEAASAADADEREAALYAEAWALAADDSSARSVKILRGMASSGTWAGPRALLLARQDIDSGAGAEAKVTLETSFSANLFVGDDVELAKAMLAELRSK
jgi:hypothetical protein